MQSPYRKAPDSWQIQTEDLPFCEATVPTVVVYHCTVPPNHIVLMVQKKKRPQAQNMAVLISKA